MIHHLKIKYEYAVLHFRGVKDWEIRKFDRLFKVGDTIQFTVIEFDFVYSRTITNLYTQTDHGLKEDYLIISISK